MSQITIFENGKRIEINTPEIAEKYFSYYKVQLLKHILYFYLLYVSIYCVLALVLGPFFVWLVITAPFAILFAYCSEIETYRKFKQLIKQK